LVNFPVAREASSEVSGNARIRVAVPPSVPDSRVLQREISPASKACAFPASRIGMAGARNGRAVQEFSSRLIVREDKQISIVERNR
jgi:hypothetical protein